MQLLRDEVRPLASAGKGKAQYSFFDFSKYTQSAGERRGLFFLRAEGWDPATGLGVPNGTAILGVL